MKRRNKPTIRAICRPLLAFLFIVIPCVPRNAAVDSSQRRVKRSPRRGGSGSWLGVRPSASRDGAKTSPVQAVLAEAAIPAALSFYYIASINVSVLRTLYSYAHTERGGEKEREGTRERERERQTHTDA